MRTRSAAFELTLLTVLVMAVLLGAFTWLYFRWERSGMLDEVQRGLSLASDTLHSSLRHGMMHNEQKEILNTIERVAHDTRIKRIRLIEHRGGITLSTVDEDLGQRVDRSAASCTLCHTGGGRADSSRALSSEARTVVEADTMRAFTPVLAEPGCVTSTCHSREAESGVLGVIDLSLSLEEVETALFQSQLQLGGLSLLALILGGGLLWFAMARRFRRPMHDVLSGIRQVADGDLNHRIPARVRDEFGELAESFNTMSRQLATVQQGLIQSERLISMGKLAAGVAHEINNPLTGILSYGEELLEDSNLSDPRRGDYEVIVREALRCRQIVRNLLDFARQDKLSLDRVSPRELVDRALAVFARQADFRKIQIRRHIEDDLPAIRVDPVQIQQVLVNLVVNAQQAMVGGGTIDLGVRRLNGGKHIEFSLKDYGPGIPSDIRSRIFEPFFSTKSGKTDGLGLAVCLGIVKHHGGTIDLDSEPGQGTTFRVVLPVDGQGLQKKSEGVSDE
jgi:two-component system NtrC family sensor kinase